MPHANSTSSPYERADLAGMLLSVEPDQRFAAQRVLPPMPVNVKEGRYPKVLNSRAWRNVSTRRAIDGTFSRGSTPFDTGTFTCEERGYEEPVDRVNKAITSGWFDQELVAAMSCRAVVEISREAEVAAMIFNTTTFPLSGSTGKNVSVEWSTAASATPIADVTTAVQTLNEKKGPGKNYLLANDLVIQNAWNSASVQDRMKYVMVNGANPNLASLAIALGVDGIIDAPAIYNTAIAGATPSMSRIWSSEYAAVIRLADDPLLRRPTLGRTFVFNRVFENDLEARIASGQQVDDRLRIEMYASNDRDADIVRAREFTDEVITDDGCLYLLGNITA